jgi:hypothetical protein
MADLATQNVTIDGVAPSYASAAGGGDKFIPDDDVFVHIKNGSGGALTATFATPRDVDGLDIENPVVSVPSSGERVIGPFPKNHFANNDDGGKCAITYSGVTSLTIGVFQVQR